MNFQFEFPFLLSVSLLAPVLLYYRIKFSPLPMPYPPLQMDHTGKTYFKILFYTKLVMECIAVVFFSIALAGPHYSKETSMIEEEGSDIVIALDISASMMAADFPPNRIEALKKIAGDFLDKRNSDRVAVVAFAGHAFTRMPLVIDKNAVKEVINSLSFYSIDHTVSGGTAIGSALLVSSKILMDSKIEGRGQAIFLITDGENSLGADPMLAAKYIADSNIRLYLLGLAGLEKVPVIIDGKNFIGSDNKPLYTGLDDKNLREIAEAAGGKFFRAIDEDSLEKVFEEVSRLEKTPIGIRSFVTKKFYSYIFSIGCFSLFFLGFILEGFFIRRPIR